jgi:Trypsin
MRKVLSLAAAVLASVALAAPVGAITHGAPDVNEHPYVGELLFFVPDAVDPRFDDPGGWFTCTGTLMSSTIVVTAGHCTFGIGLNGESTTDGGAITDAAHGGVGGNDVWISFAGTPNFDILPPSSTFGRGENQERYEAWRDALNGNSEWHRAVATPHPLYDDLAFFVHDAGVLRLLAPVSGSTFGQLAPVNYLNQYVGKAKKHVFEAVGYGLEKSTGSKAIGGDTREKSNPWLDTLKSTPPNTYAILSNNASTGGTCFGDSGGPTFDNTSSRLVVAVTSFGNNNCTGHGGVYRLDQPDDQAFLAGFGIRP